MESLSNRGDPDRGIKLDGADLESVRALIASLRRDKSRKPPYSAGQLAERLTSSDRLSRLGVRDTATLRAALREYMGCCRGPIEIRREDPIAAKKRELRFAKIPGYFPTPRALAERLVEAADIQPGHRVLEPSAGSGSIAEVIRERHADAKLDVIEFNNSLHELLKAESFNVIGYDFLAFEERYVYDRVIMNPPFEGGRDVEHIQHALGVLKQGGRLVAVASAGLSFRSDAKTMALRERIEKLGGKIEALPAGSFEESGTQVNTVMIVVDIPIPVVVAPPPKPKAKPVAVAEPVKVDPVEADIQQRWAAHVASGANVGASEWRYLPKTSCWVRKDGDVSVTLCTAIQKHAIADCSPSMAGIKSQNKQFMLCQVDEEVEYFRGGPAGGNLAKAEGPNKVVRSRTKAMAGLELARPAADDFEALERYLDSLVPSRIVYQPSDPLTPLDVKLAAPALREDGQIETWVSVGDSWQRLTLDEVENQLRDGALIPYRGLVGSSTLSAVLRHVDRRGLAKAGLTLHDVQYGRFGGRSVYWLRAPDGETTYGPYLADGEDVAGEAILREFHVALDEGLSLTPLPDGWTLENTVVVATMMNGRRLWAAWQPSTELYSIKGEGAEWSKVTGFPRLAAWNDKTGFPDFVHMISHSVRQHLKAASRSVRPRVAGPWLGVVFPSDFPEGRVVFESANRRKRSNSTSCGGCTPSTASSRRTTPSRHSSPSGVSSDASGSRGRSGGSTSKPRPRRKRPALERIRTWARRKRARRKRAVPWAKGKADKPKADKPKADKPKADKPKAATKAKKATTRKPTANGKPSANDKPAANDKPTANAKPAANDRPAASDKPAANAKPTANAKPEHGKPATGGKDSASKPAAKKRSKPARANKPKADKPAPAKTKPAGPPKRKPATTEVKPQQPAAPSTTACSQAQAHADAPLSPQRCRSVPQALARRSGSRRRQPAHVRRRADDSP